MTRKELEQRLAQNLTEEELDDLVHDLKSQEAATINNAGKEAQINFILGEAKGNREVNR